MAGIFRMEAQRREAMTKSDAANAQARSDQGAAAKAHVMTEIIQKKKGVTKLVTIQLDGEIASNVAVLKSTHAAAIAYDANHNENDTAPAVQDEIDALLEASRDTEVVFVFKAIGAPNYDALLLLPENQPSEELRKQGADFNPDHFPAALVAASCIDPEMTLEEALTIYNDPAWNGAELQKLFFGALEVNTELADIPLSKGDTSEMLSSRLNSIIAMTKESPTPSS
jgi:hypothetical protein